MKLYSCLPFCRADFVQICTAGWRRAFFPFLDHRSCGEPAATRVCLVMTAFIVWKCSKSTMAEEVCVCSVQIQANERLSLFFLLKETVAALMDNVEHHSAPSRMHGLHVFLYLHNKWVTCIKGG